MLQAKIKLNIIGNEWMNYRNNSSPFAAIKCNYFTFIENNINGFHYLRPVSLPQPFTAPTQLNNSRPIGGEDGVRAVELFVGLFVLLQVVIINQ